MRYRVALIESDEGYAVSCPELKGCHSQGATVEDALETSRKRLVTGWQFSNSNAHAPR